MTFTEKSKEIESRFLKMIQQRFKNVVKVDNLVIKNYENYFNVHFDNGVIICVNQCFNGDTWVLSQIENKLKQALENVY